MNIEDKNFSFVICEELDFEDMTVLIIDVDCTAGG